MNLLVRISLQLFAAAIVLMGLVLITVRLSMLNIESFKPQINNLLSSDGKFDVSYSKIHGTMLGFNPFLQFENLSVKLTEDQQPLLIDKLTLELDFWSSLLNRLPLIAHASGDIEKLQLKRDQQGDWWLNELPLGQMSESSAEAVIESILPLMPNFLRLDLAQLEVEDQLTESSYQFLQAKIRLNRQADHLATELRVKLPSQIGEYLLVKSQLNTDKSLIYLDSFGLNIKTLAEMSDWGKLGIIDGNLDSALWIELAGLEVTEVSGRLSLLDGALESIDLDPFEAKAGTDDNRSLSAKLTIADLGYRSTFQAKREDQSWRVTNVVGKLRIGKEVHSTFNSEFEIFTSPGDRRIAAWIDQLPVPLLTRLGSRFLSPEFVQHVDQAKVEGRVTDLSMEIDLNRIDDPKISAKLYDIDSLPVVKFPGVENLNAEVVAGNQRLGLKLLGNNVALDFADQFVAPLRFESFAMNAFGEREQGEFLLSVDDFQMANQEIKTEGRMWFKFDQEKRPFSFVRAKFSDGDAAASYKYFPLKIMPEKPLAWLSQGIKSGKVEQGELLFHGRWRRLRHLFADRAGEFFTGFEVEDVEVAFDPSWLHAKKGRGRAEFRNTSMVVELDQVSYDRLDQISSRITIAELDAALLEIAIQTETPLEDGLRVWVETPVGQKYRDLVGSLSQIGGDANVTLNLSLPLAEPIRKTTEKTVQAEIKLNAASATSDVWGVEVSQGSGLIQIDNDEIKSTQLKAHFFDDPVTVDIRPKSASADAEVQVSGQISSRNLLAKLPESWQKMIDGKSDWLLRFSSDANADVPIVNLVATSDLINSTLQLPQPLAKTQFDSRPLRVDLKFKPTELDLELTYGEVLNARGRFNPQNDASYSARSLDLAFATELRPVAATELEFDGLNLYGQIPLLQLDQWAEFFKSEKATNANWLHSVDLQVGQASFQNRVFDNAKLIIDRDEDAFVGRIDSSPIRASFKLPISSEDTIPEDVRPIIINAEYLKIDKLSDESDYSKFKPNDFPAIQFRGISVIYHDLPLSDVRFETKVVEHTLHLDQLQFRRDNITLKGEGSWEYRPVTETHLSEVKVVAEGQQLGEAMAKLGFGDNISSGKLKLDGTLTWPAPIMEFKLNNFLGDVNLRIEEGVLNNVDPGTGRFVGLFSLSALPRRLSLDFDDVLIKGMPFDKISGSYSIRDGSLYTQNTRVETPAAKIRISGRTGFVERDYDQQILVTPKLRQTVSVLGALSASNSVGWGLLLLQNLFKKSIDKAVEIEYRVTGSWDDPSVDLIKAVDENQQNLPQSRK